MCVPLATPSQFRNDPLAKLRAGPFLGSEFLSVFREVVDEYFVIFGLADDQLLRTFSGGSMSEMDIAEGHVHNTAEAWESFREHVRHQGAAMNNGSRVKLARWFSYFDCSSELEGTWSLHSFVLTYIGIRSGWFASIEDTNLFSSSIVEDGDRLHAEEPAGGNGAGSSCTVLPPRGVRDSNKDPAPQDGEQEPATCSRSHLDQLDHEGHDVHVEPGHRAQHSVRLDDDSPQD